MNVVLVHVLAFDPDFCESIKIHSPVLQDFDGLVTVHKWHHYLTWGLMSGCCLSPKNVLLSYCTVLDFGRFRTALSRNVQGIGS